MSIRFDRHISGIGRFQISERIWPPSLAFGDADREKTLSENCFTVSVVSEPIITLWHFAPERVFAE